MNELDRLMARYDPEKPLPTVYSASEIKLLANELQKAINKADRQQTTWMEKLTIATSDKEKRRCQAQVDRFSATSESLSKRLDEINHRLSDWFTA